MVVRKSKAMPAPSAATLKKYLYDWSKKGSGNAAPPLRIRWGEEQQGISKESAKPLPRVLPETKEPKPASSTSETTESVQTSAPISNDQPTVSKSPLESFQGESSIKAVQSSPTTGSSGGIYLPPPEQNAGSSAKMVAESADKKAGPSVVGTGKPATSLKAPDKSEITTPILDTEPKAIGGEGSGLFDTKGFPLGEYANLIIERIKGNWFIPSNLRNSQGHTTVVFYIGKNGQYTNARITMSSGSGSLDLAALNAVIESNPFPPLPEGFPGDHIGAKFVFSYNEHP